VREGEEVVLNPAAFIKEAEDEALKTSDEVRPEDWERADESEKKPSGPPA